MSGFARLAYGKGEAERRFLRHEDAVCPTVLVGEKKKGFPAHSRKA